MLKIAYCDDMEIDRDKIMSSLSNIEEMWKEEFEISSFTSGESLCENVAYNHYDIILLDIIMKGIDGIETANRIRAMGEENLIIFISSYDDRIKELFDFRTIAFIDKPISIEKLETALRKAYYIIKKDNERLFIYKKGRVLNYVPLKDILYFESQRNEIVIHTIKYQDTFYDTLSSIWLRVEKFEQFVMPHRSFIFNLSHITLRADKIIVRSTNEIYNIGGRYRSDTEERYLKYIEKRCK